MIGITVIVVRVDIITQKKHNAKTADRKNKTKIKSQQHCQQKNCYILHSDPRTDHQYSKLAPEKPTLLPFCQLGDLLHSTQVQLQHSYHSSTIRLDPLDISLRNEQSHRSILWTIYIACPREDPSIACLILRALAGRGRRICKKKTELKLPCCLSG